MSAHHHSRSRRELAVGESGAVFFPTHTYCFKGAAGRPVFHRDLSCYSLIGTWPEIARTAPWKE